MGAMFLRSVWGEAVQRRDAMVHTLPAACSRWKLELLVALPALEVVVKKVSVQTSLKNSG